MFTCFKNMSLQHCFPCCGVVRCGVVWCGVVWCVDVVFWLLLGLFESQTLRHQSRRGKSFGYLERDTAAATVYSRMFEILTTLAFGALRRHHISIRDHRKKQQNRDREGSVNTTPQMTYFLGAKRVQNNYRQK